MTRLEADEAKIGACEKGKASVHSGQCSPKRNGARLPIFLINLYVVCYCGMPSHFVGTESYKKRNRIFLTAVK